MIAGVVLAGVAGLLFSPVAAYNLAFTTRQFNAGYAIAKAPNTLLNAVGSARGRGFNPATMQADLVATVSPSMIDTIAVDRANVKVAAANGMVRGRSHTQRCATQTRNEASVSTVL